MPTVRTPTDHGKPGLQQEKIDGGLKPEDRMAGFPVRSTGTQKARKRRYEVLATVFSVARALAAKPLKVEKQAECWVAAMPAQALLMASSRVRQELMLASSRV